MRSPAVPGSGGNGIRGGCVRILQVNKFYDPRGGTERVLFDLEDGLRARGHEVAVFACEHPDNRASEWSRYFVGRRDYDRPGPIDRVRHALGTVYDLGARRALGRLLDDFRPDVAHLHNVYHQLSPSVLDALRSRDVPTVMTLHDYKLACPVYRLFRDGEICTKCVGTEWPLWVGVHGCSRGSRAESWLLALESTVHRMRRSYERGVSVFVSPSRFLADVVRKQGIPSRRIRVIRNAPRHRPPVADPGARAPRPRVLYAGRISPEKGVDLLIEAARGVPEVEVRVAGTGADAKRLGAASSDLANVRWLGHLGPEDLEAERAAAWAVAVPSRWYENAPLSVIEAFCSGRPVLAADHGGLVEMVEPEVNGWRIPPGDVEAWSEALRRLPTAQSELMLMGMRARAVADRDHDHERFLDTHEALYGELVARAKGVATR